MLATRGYYVETKGIEPFTPILQGSVAPLEHVPPKY